MTADLSGKGGMRVLRVRALVVGVALVLGLVSIGCGTSNTTSTPPSPSQAAPSTGLGLPAELADAVLQADGTYRTPDGRVFSSPDEFFSEECGDVRWPVADDTVDLALAAGVPVDPVEWLSHHVHTYLGVFVDGEPEVVPAGIGIDNDGHRIAGLHTHDCSGTVHLEAEKPIELTLGQFVDTWGVKLDGECFADLCAPDNTVAVQVDGEPVADARAVVIVDCNVITILIGDPPAEIPPAAAEGC
jgi:hypothetical protein